MRRSAKGTFVLSVRVKLASQAELDAFVEVFRPLAEYVQRHEPDTVFYEMALADQKPFEVLIHERYSSRAAFEEVHRVSAPFLEFKRRVAALPFTVAFDGVSYEELGYGFV
ncbi:hypothetical protein H632_c3289p1 [Helicosporidium sp. ATCC 50920]|nr:hypothetical protein H632_c3289p1 [Helicosporidium sp. ATCC 50920]|eukprot:KDD72483.1 hypothetical protein H632_c3289p1 [Helicosporidium sp. ATCC 50920]